MPPTEPPKHRYADSVYVRYVHSLPREFYLAREAADMLNVAPSMMNFLARDPEKGLGPTHQAMYGSTVLRLYTPERIAKIRKHLIDRPDDWHGMKRIFTPVEQIERRRQAQAFRNYEARAREYAAKGRTAQAEAAQAKCDELRKAFNEFRAARCAELGIPDHYAHRVGGRKKGSGKTKALS